MHCGRYRWQLDQGDGYLHILWRIIMIRHEQGYHPGEDHWLWKIMLSMHLWFSVIKCGGIMTISFKSRPFWLPHCDDCTLQLWARTNPFSWKLCLSGIPRHSNWRVTMICSKVTTLDTSRPEQTNLIMVLWLVCRTPPIVQGLEYLVPGW